MNLGIDRTHQQPVLPLKFALLYLLSHSKVPLYDSELITQLSPYYSDEGHFRRTIVVGHLESLRNAGLIEEAESNLLNTSDLTTSYKITTAGKARLKYLSKTYQMRSVRN